MARLAKPYVTTFRKYTNTYQFSLNTSCGLPKRICDEWKRKSFHLLPDELANYRQPKTDKAAEAGVVALIVHLNKLLGEEGSARRNPVSEITVGEWVEKFTVMETSPRTGLNASKNRPYSLNTIDTYFSYYNCHIKDDPICKLKMAEIEEEDVLEYVTRLSVKKFVVKKDGKEVEGEEIGGSRTFGGVISLMRMAFTEYQKKAKRWFNPFQYMDAPKNNSRPYDALTEDEVISLFEPGVLIETEELVACGLMFLSGLRTSEVYAQRSDDLDWSEKMPIVWVCQAWQRLHRKGKKMGPTKGKKARRAPFDPILQQAIKKLWEENGKHEYILSRKDGKQIGNCWIKRHFPKWLKRAGIEFNGRRIVPHSSRHSLASMLEARGVPLRYIQELLGHKDLKTTLIYLHETEKTFRAVGSKISEAMNKEQKENKVFEFKVS